MTSVLAPSAGTVIAITEVEDPVFAGQMVGPGVGIRPAAGRTTVVAPVAGTIVKLHPHAIAMATPEGAGVLVHLGIDTVGLNGEGFEVIATEGASIAAGDPVVTWDPAEIAAKGLSDTIIVVALDRPADSISSGVIGTEVTAGTVLFEL
ncbi:MAG: PTS glucose transporter subunit IIA [Propionicimonas sp.]|nr:PTS glucose transporter subunit IIA [Propionicimonas sp.]